MSRPPLIPEPPLNSLDDTQESKAIRVDDRRAGRRRLASVPLLIGLLLLTIAFGGVATLLVYQPELFGLELVEDGDSTRVAFQGTADALQITANVLQSTADAVNQTQQFNFDAAQANSSTRAALENQQQQLSQQETQAAVDAIGTQTAIAQENARQATQGALDFQNTQVAFQRLATQAEIEFQGTQASLNRDATSAALGFATNATGNASTPDGADALTQTPIATETPAALFTDGFNEGIDGALWNFSAVPDWRLNADGLLTAQTNGGWILTQQTDFDAYTFEIELVLPANAEGLSYNYVLLNLTNEGGIAVETVHNGDRLTNAGLYQLTTANLVAGEFLSRQGLDVLQAVQVTSAAPNPVLSLRAELRGARLVVVGNGQLLLDVTFDAEPIPGAIGAYVTQGVQLRRIALFP